MTLILDGEVVLISGAGGGIGRATALAAAREGARIALLDMDDDKLAESAEAMDNGVDCLCLRADISDAAQVEAAMARLLAHWGRLDHAFNNAGISQAHCNAAGQTLGEISAEAFAHVLHVNVIGTFIAMQTQIRQMRQQGGGTIVNMGSVTGLVGRPRSGAYATSKHAVVGLTRSAAMEFATEGLRINCICPGFIETDFIQSSKALRADQLMQSTPMNRFGRPEEVADAVIWLMSPRSSFVTGAIISVDGGFAAG